MAGINDNTLIYGVMDLIERSMRRQEQAALIKQIEGVGGNVWEGQPSTLLYREHPEDKDVLTSVELLYSSGYSRTYTFNRGMSEGEIEQALAYEGEPPPPVPTPIEDLTGEVLPPENLLPPEQQQGWTPPTDSISAEGNSYTILPTLPMGVDRNHPDFEYCTKWRLKNVLMESTDPSGASVSREYIHLAYDRTGNLTAAVLERI